MKISATFGPITDIICDTLIIGIYEEMDKLSKSIEIPDAALKENISRIIYEHSESGKYGTTTVVYTYGMIGAKKILLLGLGKKEQITFDKVRSLSGLAARMAQKLNSQVIAFSFWAELAEHQVAMYSQALVEGAILGVYEFTYYKTQVKNNSINKILLVEDNPDNIRSIEQGISIGQIIAEAVCAARDMVNHPAKFMTPTKMALKAEEIAIKNNLGLTVLDKQDMEKHNMNALLAVAQGSAEPPKLIVLKYTGNTASNDCMAFVGKGITFDSGGISLKPSEGMAEMKDDMAGGAAVLGAMLAISKLKPAVNIMGIIPCAENMPSGSALKPGDVIYSMQGKTIEVVNTDAEGRLILADALYYAIKLGANRLIDIATLTGACVVSLGNITSGMITNNRQFCQQVKDAAEKAGEKIWELPNFEEYKEQIKSNIADLKNSGGRPAGAITAGLFLAEFVGNTPWVHIDIAGTANSDKDSGYNVKGATGVGVRTLIQMALQERKI